MVVHQAAAGTLGSFRARDSPSESGFARGDSSRASNPNSRTLRLKPFAGDATMAKNIWSMYILASHERSQRSCSRLSLLPSLSGVSDVSTLFGPKMTVSVGLDSPLILGVLEIGTFMSLFLAGVVAVQGYVYFLNCREDRYPPSLRVFVAFILLLEFCHAIASVLVIFQFTVLEAGLPELAKPADTYSLSLTPVFETLITTSVQGFFGYRIYVLSGRMSVALACWVLCLVRFATGMSVAVVSFLDVPLEPDFFHLQDTYGWIISLALNVGVVLDIIMTGFLCVYTRRTYTPYIGDIPRGQDVIQRLILWTIRLVTRYDYSESFVPNLKLNQHDVGNSRNYNQCFAGPTQIQADYFLQFQTMKNNFVWLALYTLLAKRQYGSLPRQAFSGKISKAQIAVLQLNARPSTTLTRKAVSGSRPSASDFARDNLKSFLEIHSRARWTATTSNSSRSEQYRGAPWAMLPLTPTQAADELPVMYLTATSESVLYVPPPAAKTRQESGFKMTADSRCSCSSESAIPARRNKGSTLVNAETGWYESFRTCTWTVRQLFRPFLQHACYDNQIADPACRPWQRSLLGCKRSCTALRSTTPHDEDLTSIFGAALKDCGRAQSS
uniref:Uncharacterized protein n=1 Tax=Mycena chlorophos TaxID=658473 RepID=A0ABQ0MB82_MYCCL|nr:predicted protein [Mycena chlorophos]